MLSVILNLGNLISVSRFDAAHKASMGNRYDKNTGKMVGAAEDKERERERYLKELDDKIKAADKESRKKLKELLSKLSSLDGGKQTFTDHMGLKFPNSLGDNVNPMPFIRYKPYNYSATGQTKKGDSKSQSAGPIYLSMVSSVTQNTNPNWAQESDILSQFGAVDTNKNEGDQGLLDTVGSAFTAGVVKGAAKIVQSVTSALGTPDITKAKMRRHGATFNPFNERFFDGISYRVYSFEHKFLPESVEDSAAVFSIIRRFQYFSLPDYAFNKNFLTYPSFWRIGFFQSDSTRNQFLPILDDCVITLVGVVFGGGGTWAELQAGEPVEVTLSLQVTETSIPTKSRMLNEESISVRGSKIDRTLDTGLGKVAAIRDRMSFGRLTNNATDKIF